MASLIEFSLLNLRVSEVRTTTKTLMDMEMTRGKEDPL